MAENAAQRENTYDGTGRQETPADTARQSTVSHGANAVENSTAKPLPLISPRVLSHSFTQSKAGSVQWKALRQSFIQKFFLHCASRTVQT